MPSGKERRKFSRLSEFDEITYSIIPQSKSVKRLTLDLSAGGIRLISDGFIPVNSLLKIEIKLKHSDKVITAIAKAAWIKSLFDDEHYEVGIEFKEIKKEDLRFFKLLCGEEK